MDKIEEIAAKHVETLGEITPGFKYTYTNRRELSFQVVFDYSFINIKTQRPATPPVAGGAVGFCIHKSSLELQSLSFGELRELEYQERELEVAYQNLLEIRASKGSFAWLKSRYQLNSVELLRFKKKLMAEDLRKEDVLEILDNWTNKIKSK